MITPFSCPSCGAVADGERCRSCGEQLITTAGDDRLTVAVPGLVIERGNAETSAAPEPPRQRSASAYLSLEPSETAVLHAASRIFAGYIARGAVNDDNENEMADHAVRLATRMALVIEKYVQSDNEDW